MWLIFPIFADWWYYTGVYRTRVNLLKDRVKSTSHCLEMLKKQRPSRENLFSKCLQSLFRKFTGWWSRGGPEAEELGSNFWSAEVDLWQPCKAELTITNSGEPCPRTGETRGRASLSKTEIQAQPTSRCHVIAVTDLLPCVPNRGKGELSLVEDNICNLYGIFITSVQQMIQN